MGFFLLLLLLLWQRIDALQTRPPRFDRGNGNDVFSTLKRAFKPITNVVQNTYSFFYWLPRRNTPYDVPWVLFRNTSSEFLAYYQWPHNLPPYIYLSEGYPEDFFCWGLPGNTLPLGNWDPWFMQNTSPQVRIHTCTRCVVDVRGSSPAPPRPDPCLSLCVVRARVCVCR